jgi:hypothetical protein
VGQRCCIIRSILASSICMATDSTFFFFGWIVVRRSADINTHNAHQIRDPDENIDPERFDAHRVSIMSTSPATRIVIYTQRTSPSYVAKSSLESKTTNRNISPPSDRSRLLKLDNPPQCLFRLADLATELVRLCQFQPRFRVIPTRSKSREPRKKHVCSFPRCEPIKLRWRWILFR